MDLVCPVCNGLYDYKRKCVKCNTYSMVDRGRLTDYYDEYSTYLPMTITNKVDGVYSHKKCIHLYVCEKCGEDKRVVINKIPV